MNELLEAITKLPTREMYADGKPVQYLRKGDVLAVVEARQHDTKAPPTKAPDA